MEKRLGAVVFFVAMMGALSPASQASPVEYDTTAGSSITIFGVDDASGSTVMNAQAINMTAPSNIVFDSGPPASLPSFEFATTGTDSLNGTGSYAAFIVKVSNVSIVPQGSGAPGYSDTVTGTGSPYGVTFSGLWASGSYSVFSTANPSIALTSGTFTDKVISSPVSGQLQIGSDSLALNGITIDQVSWGSGANAKTLDIKADINFVGTPVPLPPAAGLLALGLAPLLAAARRRRAS